jgi:hypothetical protein
VSLPNTRRARRADRSSRVNRSGRAPRSLAIQPSWGCPVLVPKRCRATRIGRMAPARPSVPGIAPPERSPGIVARRGRCALRGRRRCRQLYANRCSPGS